MAVPTQPPVGFSSVVSLSHFLNSRKGSSVDVKSSSGEKSTLSVDGKDEALSEGLEDGM